MSHTGSAPADKETDPGVQRFQLELEFVQCLANPTYIHYLAQNRYFEDEAFIGYLKYLKYWQRPEYIKYIIYPHCLFFLELLQNANFRNAMAHPANKELAHRQQYFFWKNYRNNRLKHILPRPPPEPAPVPAPSQGPATVPLPPSVSTPVAPPVPAPSSSMPPVAAGGASAMSPMQFVGTPGTNMPKTDMRNAMGNRKRKYAPPFAIIQQFVS
jgi:mediator of RNA polymerase II transcription subunit 31